MARRVPCRAQGAVVVARRFTGTAQTERIATSIAPLGHLSEVVGDTVVAQWGKSLKDPKGSLVLPTHRGDAGRSAVGGSGREVGI
jgi:hypothetical protein